MPGSITPKVRFYYVYILESLKDEKNYVGFTMDLKRRIETHKNGLIFSTKYRRPFRLIYFEACLNEKDALRRERFLKSSDGRFYIKKRLREYYKFL
jgi:putative endonuclease